MRLTFCALCGNTDTDNLEHHHVIPRSAGGSNEEANLLTVCTPCHGMIHGMTRKVSIRELTLAGLARAKAQGRVGGRRHKMTAAQVEQALEMMADGASSIVVAQAFGVGRTTLYRSITAMTDTVETATRGRKPKLTPEQIEMARGLLEGGKPPGEVAQAFGVGRTTLYRSLQRAGGDATAEEPESDRAAAA